MMNDITLRIFLVYKMLMKWDADLIYTKIAFLHGEMEDIIYESTRRSKKIEGEDENNET